MRRLIAWTMTLAAGASAVATASGQGTAPAPRRQSPAPAATKPAAPAATKPAAAPPLDPAAVKARELALRKAREEMNQILADWEKQSKKVMSLYVEFDRVDYSKIWGDEYFVGQAILKSPDMACLEFRKVKVDGDNKPVKVADAKGKQAFDLEKDPTQRIVCTGKDVLQFEWDERVIYVYPLDKEVRQKALQQGPLPFLFNMKAAEAKARYGMSLLQQDENYYVISVVPNEDIDKDSFSRAFVWLSKENFLPKKLQLYPVQGNAGKPKEVQEFTFRNIQPNAAVDDDYFKPNLKIAGWQIKRNPAEGANNRGVPVAPTDPASARPAGTPRPGVAQQPATRPGPRPR